MNYIFDIGNVLVNYKPKEFLAELFVDEAVIDRLFELIFLSPEWVKMDTGLLSHDEAVRIFCDKQPDMRAAIIQVMQNVYDIFTPIYGTIELLPVIKNAGHKLYYLSNIQEEIRDYLLLTYDYFKLFDGGVFSCDVKLIKPSLEIYRHLLAKYNLLAGDCVFYDDMEENIIAAQAEGIQGVLFTDAECVDLAF